MSKAFVIIGMILVAFAAIVGFANLLIFLVPLVTHGTMFDRGFPIFILMIDRIAAMMFMIGIITAIIGFAIPE